MTEYKKYFKNQEELLYKLEQLHKRKINIKEMIQDSSFSDSFVVEISGLPRTGKSVSLEKIYSFFKEGNIKIEKALEPAFLIKRDLSINEIKQMSNLEFNDKTLELSKKSLDSFKNKNPNLILMDRGIIDNYFWYQMMFEEETLSVNEYQKKLNLLQEDITKVDQLFVMTALPEIIIYRDYINQLYLEDRRKTTLERVTMLKDGYDHLLPKIKEEDINVIEMDTTNKDEMSIAIDMTNSIIDNMEKKILIKRK